MERKYIFFDIDGTLLDDNPGGKILESTYRTLDKLKENGHFVAIATGRAQYMAMDAAKEAHIDCLVTDGGNGITLHNELQYIKPIDFVQANRVIDQCIEHHLPFAVALGNEAVLYTNQSDQKDQKLPVKLAVDESIDFHQVKEIYKVFIECGEQEEKLLDLGTLEYMRYFKGQIIIEPADKYKGILEMVHLLKGNEKDIVVIICMAGILYVFLSQGQRIIQKLGPVGNQIINKLVAFFTFCIGIQISVTGISQIFHLNIL